MRNTADLRGHSILIVEGEVGPFCIRLQAAIDQTGAESVIALDIARALVRIKQFRFSAAVVNGEHRKLAVRLGVPLLFYGSAGDVVPARADKIVSALKHLLAV